MSKNECIKTRPTAGSLIYCELQTYTDQKHHVRDHEALYIIVNFVTEKFKQILIQNIILRPRSILYHCKICDRKILTITDPKHTF